MNHILLFLVPCTFYLVLYSLWLLTGCPGRFRQTHSAGGDLTWGGPGGDGGGGGGRIAVWSKYDSSSGVSASVDGGAGYETGETGTVVWGQIPIPGSIFLIR